MNVAIAKLRRCWKGITQCEGVAIVGIDTFQPFEGPACKHTIYSNDKEIFVKYRDNAYIWLSNDRKTTAYAPGMPSFPAHESIGLDEVYRFWSAD